MSNDESRKQFEECFRAKYKNDPDFDILLEQHNHGTEEDPDIDYYSLAARDAWHWWQASRQAIEIDLPKACAGDEYFIDGVFQPMRYERDVERALSAAGLKIKGE